jgi:hypothetical protein
VEREEIVEAKEASAAARAEIAPVVAMGETA